MQLSIRAFFFIFPSEIDLLEYLVSCINYTNMYHDVMLIACVFILRLPSCILMTHLMNFWLETCIAAIHVIRRMYVRNL